MKNNLKQKIFADFLFIFEKEMPNLTEATKRKLSNILTDSCYETFNENSLQLAKQYSNSVDELEKHRKQFRDLIDQIQKSTDKLLIVFNRDSFVKKEFDTATRTFYLKSRTRMVDDMVEYLNTLNKLVISFYTEVYKIEQSSIDFPNITLF